MVRCRRHWLLTLLGIAWFSIAWPASASSAPTKKKAKRTNRVQRIARGPTGTTLRLKLDSAPFPAPGAPYRDSTVLVFVPRHFRADRWDRIDLIVHFHGHNTTAEAAMKRFKLREQLVASKQNAILVVPQGPIRAADSRGGKLDRKDGLLDLLSDVRRTLQRKKVRAAIRPVALPSYMRVGKVVLSAHSGGWRVVANCLRRGGFNVNEVYLFDALYADADAFADWLAETRDKHGVLRHKLVSYFADPEVEANNRKLMKRLDQLKLRYKYEQLEGQLSRAQLTRGRAIFIKTRASHHGVLFRFNALRDCLHASVLERHLRSGWFERKTGPRPLEKRR